MAIHGGSVADKSPAIDGMLDTLTSNCSLAELSEKILSDDCKVSKIVKKEATKKWSQEFYDSKKNTLRSIDTYFANGVLGKARYKKIRSRNSQHDAPTYIPYEKLVEEINSISNHPESLHDINPIFTYDLEEDCAGMYRSCDLYLLHLAWFYLQVNQHRVDNFLQFPNLPKFDKDAIGSTLLLVVMVLQVNFI